MSALLKYSNGYFDITNFVVFFSWQRHGLGGWKWSDPLWLDINRKNLSWDVAAVVGDVGRTQCIMVDTHQ